MTVRAHGVLACALVSLGALGAESRPRGGVGLPQEGAAQERVSGAPPTLEWLRECVLRKGVPPQLAKIEAPGEGGEAAPDVISAEGGSAPPLTPTEARRESGAPSSDVLVTPDLPAAREGAGKTVSGTFYAKHPSGRPGKRFLTPFSPRRLVFWTRTRRLTQSVIVAVLDGRREGAYVRIQSAGLARVGAGHPRLAELMAYVLDRNFALTGAQFARDASDGEVVLRTDVPCANGLAEADFLLCLESVLAAADGESARIASVLHEGQVPLGSSYRTWHEGQVPPGISYPCYKRPRKRTRPISKSAEAAVSPEPLVTTHPGRGD